MRVKVINITTVLQNKGFCVGRSRYGPQGQTIGPWGGPTENGGDPCLMGQTTPMGEGSWVKTMRPGP